MFLIILHLRGSVSLERFDKDSSFFIKTLPFLIAGQVFCLSYQHFSCSWSTLSFFQNHFFFSILQLEELEQAAPSWIERLDTYMDIEKGAWREHSAVARQQIEEAGEPSEEHTAAVSEMRESLVVEE